MTSEDRLLDQDGWRRAYRRDPNVAFEALLYEYLVSEIEKEQMRDRLPREEEPIGA